MKYKKINLKNYKDNRGVLTPIEFKNKLKTNIKRIFVINGKKGSVRGNHAHKKCIQFFFQLQGKCLVQLSNKKVKKNFVLDKNKKFILMVYPKTWVKINFLTKNNLTLVLCSHKYNKNEYINDFNKI